MKRICIFIILTCMFVLTACSQNLDKFVQDEVAEAYLNEMLACLEEDKEEEAYKLFEQGLYEKDVFSQVFEEMRGYWCGGTYTYSLIGYYKQLSKSNGTSKYQIECTYRVEAEDKNYQISMIHNGDAVNGLVAFSLTDEEVYKNQTTPTGTITTIADFNMVQWGLLLYSAVVYVFMIITCIHCVKHPIKKKPLWIALIILIHVGAGLSKQSNGIVCNMRIYLLDGFSKLLIYPDGSFMLKISVPLGIILYWILQKKFQKQRDKIPEDSIEDDLSSPTEI